jgi:hypothetical protein
MALVTTSMVASEAMTKGAARKHGLVHNHGYIPASSEDYVFKNAVALGNNMKGPQTSAGCPIRKHSNASTPVIHANLVQYRRELQFVQKSSSHLRQMMALQLLPIGEQEEWTSEQMRSSKIAFFHSEFRQMMALKVLPLAEREK